MKEIKYKPSIKDSNAVLTKPSCPCLLVRIRPFRFILREQVSTALIYAFSSKALGDYFDLNPNVKAVDLQFIQLHASEGVISSKKELRLMLSHQEKIILNERDEIFILQRFKGTSGNNEATYTPECIWGLPNEGFLGLILMSNRFAHIIEHYSRGLNQKQTLLRFWLDYRAASLNPRKKLDGKPPHLICGEFTTFLVTPLDDGKIIFDVPPEKQPPNSI
ncbi:hypothetical protein [Cerasicoccus fimbriatus]|uniref:hypothetical protein n=1 Tax=Cerasicoccus fimbriatus TaxID=3014554 RepID=UPI0022B2E7D7|nr:hypothetical protein [Cerasicoccus sp. TK19100]